MEKSYLMLIIERYKPLDYALKIQHFDSSLDIVRFTIDVPPHCIDSIVKQLGIDMTVFNLRRRVYIPFESLAQIDDRSLDESCRHILYQIYRNAKPGNVIAIEVRG